MTNETTTMSPVTDTDINDFCARIATHTAEYFARHYSNLTPPNIYADKGGRKYIRIVRADVDGSSRSVICFVERSTGLIWKAAGWKAPAKNFSRGNIRSDNRFSTGGIYGC